MRSLAEPLKPPEVAAEGVSQCRMLIRASGTACVPRLPCLQTLLDV